MTHLRHERPTYELRGLIFEVRKKLKAGWSEEIYHQALVQLLKDRDIPFRSKPRKTIIHRGIEVQIFECDLIVRDLIILELKALPFATFAAGHYAQLFHYLKCWNKDLGLLVNFGPTRAQIERFVWDEPELEIREDYDAIRSDMTDADRLCLRRVRQSVLDVAQQYGLGYPETMYRRIVAIEMDHNDLSCHANVEIPARFDSKVLTQHPSDHLLVEGNYLPKFRPNQRQLAHLYLDSPWNIRQTCVKRSEWLARSPVINKRNLQIRSTRMENGSRQRQNRSS